MITGIYQHFKGPYYEVMGIAKHSETLEELVVYRDETGDMWIRPVAMFAEEVDRDGYKGPRFNLVRPIQRGHIRIPDFLKD